MTRDQITSIVTATVGQTDAGAVSICNDYVQRALEMVWNAALWKDTVTIDTSPTVAQGTNTFALPANYDRIVSLQLLSGGVPVGFLDPTTSSFILQTEPTALTSQGTPTKYEEFVHTDGSRKIRVFPVPNAAYTFTLSGKRSCPTLTGSDSLQIRNIDNAVIALATADMYTRLRVLGKAAEMAKKAGAFIEEAKNIELQQANQPRTASQLTASGNGLYELANDVAARTGQWTPDAFILIKQFLRRNYQAVYDSNLWTESTVVIDKTSVAGILVLPEFVDRVISIRGNANLGQLSAVQGSIYFGINPWIFEQTGDPLAFSYLTSVAVSVLPNAAVSERLSIVSSSASDKSPVYISGETAETASVVNESLTLNGTTPVLTANFYHIPLTIAKGITLGNVTVVGVTSAVTMLQLLANERERKHIRIQFQPTPTANVTCKILCKRKITPLAQDEDTPMLRDIGNVLINLATADMFSKIGNKDGAAEARAKANDDLKTLISLEMTQGAISPQIVPEVEYYGYDYYDDMAFIAKA